MKESTRYLICDKMGYMAVLLCTVFLSQFFVSASAQELSDTVPQISVPIQERVEITDEEAGLSPDSLALKPLPPIAADSLAMDSVNLDSRFRFTPNPSRAVWLSALFPGLGQVYNRRYWKLPIVVGGFLGISYALNWNNRMLGDYTRAYRDLTDNDPNTNSYLDFFHSTVDTSSLDKSWLERTFKAKKDFYRRNRDLSIICMVGMYLLCMVDAYVDASLAQFDVSPDISMNVSPSVIPSVNYSSLPAFGVQWSLNF